MITKALVEEIISPYEVKIRIPLLDRTSSSSLSTSKDNLNTATICSLPNCYTNIQVGDVVFVGFEDNTYYKAVILGHLCRQTMTDTFANVTFNDLTVRSVTKLSSNTSIGDVTSDNIRALQGCTQNIQRQLDTLQSRIDELTELLNSKE